MSLFNSGIALAFLITYIYFFLRLNSFAVTFISGCTGAGESSSVQQWQNWRIWSHSLWLTGLAIAKFKEVPFYTGCSRLGFISVCYFPKSFRYGDEMRMKVLCLFILLCREAVVET